MKKYFIYRSYFFVKQLPVEPFYLWHKAENNKAANINAKMYFHGYLYNRRDKLSS